MNNETFNGFTNQNDRNDDQMLRYTDSNCPIGMNDEVSIKGDKILKLYIVGGVHPDFDDHLVLYEISNGMVFLQHRRVVHYTKVLKVLVIAADKEAA